MGTGIAQVAAQAGVKTILYELNQAVLEKAKGSIEKNLDSLVEKGKLTTANKTDAISKIEFTNDINNCMADLFIEAIIEKPDAKVSLFRQLAELNGENCIFASNTSSLSLIEIAHQLKMPSQLVGMHFFNPAPFMKLVEVVNTEFTDPKITTAIVELAEKMGKTPVVCQDSPGFIVNRVARPYYIESLRLAEKGNVSLKKIDALLESTGFKMGPFKLMDLIGNDINYAVSSSLYEQLGKPDRLRPSPIQKDKVDSGELGRKSGKGYYDYT